MSVMQGFIDFLEKEGVYLKSYTKIDGGGKRELLTDTNGDKCIYVQFDEVEGYGNYYNCKDGQSNYYYYNNKDKALTKKEIEDIKKQQVKKRKAEKIKKDERYIVRQKEIIESFKTLGSCEDHAYFKNKNISIPSLVRGDKEKVFIPMVDYKGLLWNLQSIDKKGLKLFQFDAKTAETFFPIGWKPSAGIPDILVVCEGVATGCSIYEATGLPIACAMDVHKMGKVLAKIHKEKSGCSLIIAADNDQWRFKLPKHKSLKDIDKDSVSGDDLRWVEWREKKLLHNIGFEKAKEYGIKYNAQVVVPDIPQDNPDKLSDFNDLHSFLGLESIKKIFDKIINPPEKIKPEPLNLTPPTSVEQYGDIPEEVHYNITPKHIQEAFKQGHLINDDGFRLPFRALGYNQDVFYVFSFLDKQIIALTTSSMTRNNMIRLAEDDDWITFFSPKKKLSNAELLDKITRLIIRACQERGFFVPSDSVRGSGVWIDRGRVVIHYGNKVSVDGKEKVVQNVDSDHVYVVGKQIKDTTGELTDGECLDFIDVCSRALWSNNLSGLVLAGWITSSLACSAFDWRAHLWIMGLSSSGKSTVINKIVRSALAVNVLNADQGTTESSIRNGMRHDGKPLVYDEADKDEMSIKTIMDNVLLLARAASDGKVISKRGQEPIRLVFSACFGGINPLIDSSATSSRIMQLRLVPPSSKDLEGQYADWLLKIEDTINKDFSAKLFKRVALNIKTLLKNQIILKRALIKITKNSRASDQLSYALAGAWLLKSTEVISDDDAINWLIGKDWSSFTTAEEKPDSEKLIEYLSKVSVVIKTPMGQKDMTIGGLIYCAARAQGDIGMAKANEALNQYNMKVQRETLYIASESRAIGTLLRDKPAWASRTSGWNNILRYYPNAKLVKKVTFSKGSLPSEAVSIPIDAFVVHEYKNSNDPQHNQDNSEDIAW